MTSICKKNKSCRDLEWMWYMLEFSLLLNTAVKGTSCLFVKNLSKMHLWWGLAPICLFWPAHFPVLTKPDTTTIHYSSTLQGNSRTLCVGPLECSTNANYLRSGSWFSWKEVIHATEDFSQATFSFYKLNWFIGLHPLRFAVIWMLGKSVASTIRLSPLTRTYCREILTHINMFCFWVSPNCLIRSFHFLRSP